MCQQLATENIPGYHITHFTDENGLPQNSVKSIAADQRGNIWLATERGLVRYDGRQLVKFDDFGSAYVDRNISGFYLNPRPGHTDFVAVTQAKKWIGIADGKAMIDTTRKGNPLFKPVWDQRMFDTLEDEDRLFFDQHSSVIPIYPCPDDRYFAYDKKNVGYYVANQLAKVFFFPERSFNRFFRIRTDLYYLDPDLRLFHFDGMGSDSVPRPAVFRGAILTQSSHFSKKQSEIFWNNTCGQVFLSMGSSLYFLEPATGGDLTSKLILEGFDFKTKTVKSIFFDAKTGRTFLGTERDGLYILDKKSFRTVTANGVVPDDIYYGQTVFDRNSILTPEGVKFSLDSAKGTVSTHRVAGIAKASNGDQYSILKDRLGKIWCKQGVNLFCFDQTGNQLRSTWTITGGISPIYEGLNGRIWIGTSTGLYYCAPEGHGSSLRFFSASQKIRHISWIQQLSDTVLWVGTGQGLFKLNLISKKVSPIRGLENTYIRSLYIPSGLGELWITTYADGLFLLKGEKLTHFPMDKKQYLSSAHCILEDKNGFFWVTTNRGLFQIKKRDLVAYADQPFELYYHYYAKTAGFNTNEFNGGCQPCALRTANGIVSLPSLNGLVWFVPEQIKPELPNQQIYLEDLTINNVPWKVASDTISLQADASEMAVKVTSPYFGDPYNFNLSYRISKDGRPVTDWNALNNDEWVISFPFLGSGNYILSIRKINGFGAHNYDYKNLTIVVEKRWYETGWFYFLSGLGVLLLLFIYAKSRIKTIQKRNTLLELQIGERTKELKGTLQELEASQSEVNRQIHLQSRLMASIAHDVRTPLRAAIVVAREMKNLIHRQQYKEASVFSENIEDAMVGVKDSLEGLLAYVKIQVYKREVKKGNVLLHELIEKNFQLYGKSPKLHANTFVNQIPKELTVLTSQHLLDVIIRNLVDNANKFTDSGTVRAYVVQVSSGVKLVIEDNGQGVPESLLTWINDPHSTNTPPGYNGIGLIIIKELVPFVAEIFKIEPLPAGTAVSLYFPGLPEAEPE